ncbi:MAG: FAD-binding oxidoreductase [Bacteroidota bacterium]
MAVNQSYWEKEHFFKFDVIIIGSGLVGITAALSLRSKSNKLKIAILERGFLPSGASTKNAGFACFGSISELIEQEISCGTDALHALIKRRWNGLQKLRGLLGDEAIDFQNNCGYELFKKAEKLASEKSTGKINHFNNLVKDIVNKENVFKIADNKIGSFGFQGIDTLIENELEAQIDPGKMMQVLIQKAACENIQIFNSCEVTSIEDNNKYQRIITNNGTYTCSKILVCTNAFAGDLVPGLDLKPGRGQIIVTSAIPNLKIKGTFHYDKGFYYFRNLDGRLLLGGGRNLDFLTEQTDKFGQTETIQNALKSLISEVILPGISFEITHSWSGIMAFGNSIYPIIKKVNDATYCAVRCNGMGIAMGAQTGEDAAELLFADL